MSTIELEIQKATLAREILSTTDENLIISSTNDVIGF